MAVEFTLLLPVMLLLLFGVPELAAAWCYKQMLVSASREGARLGSLYSEPPLSNNDVVTYVVDQLDQSSFPGSVSVNVTGADGSPGDTVRVEVSSSYQFPILSSLIPGVAGSMTLESVTVMRHE